MTALTACACSSAPRAKGATTRGLKSYAVLPLPLKAVVAHRSAASVEARRSRSPSPRAAAAATKTTVASRGRSDLSMVGI